MKLGKCGNSHHKEFLPIRHMPETMHVLEVFLLNINCLQIRLISKYIAMEKEEQ